MAEKCTNYEFSKKHLDSCRYSIATCKENSKKYSIGDKKRQYRLGKLKYDGGYYRGNEEAADFIFYTCSNLKDNSLKVAVVVELKGRHVEKAFPQIVATLNREKDSILLSKNIIFASPIKFLNDPFEGSVMLPKADRHEHWVTPIMQDIGNIGIYSLSKPTEKDFPNNELLWAHYANSHKGFCIEYDLNKLIDNYSKEYDIRNVINVQYQDERPEVTEVDDTFTVQKKVFGTKSLAWKYENEIRLVFNTAGKKTIISEAVTGIYFGLRISLEDRRDIIQRTQGRNIDYYQIERIDNSYNLKSTKLIFDFSHKVINVECRPTVDNYMILYTSPNKDINTMQEFVDLFRRTLTKPSNITIIDDIRANDVLQNYKPRKDMTREEISVLSNHWLAYSSFDAPNLVWMYPEK